jgi:CelD/BcsL family acetyltransferase involved in cellulose biosynthesis
VTSHAENWDSRVDLLAAWNRALTADAAPMQEPEWTRACLETLDAGTELVPETVADGSGAAVGLLVWRAHEGRLELPGVRQLAEPMDLVYSSEEALEELVGRMRSSGRALHLGRLPADSPTAALVERIYGRRGVVRTRPASGTPTLALDAGWEDPLARLSSRRRSDFRRAARRAEQIGPVETELHAPGPTEVGELLDAAIAVEAESWKGPSGSALAADPARRAFFERYALLAAERGILRIAFLRIGDRRAAMQIAVESGGRFWLIKVGYDESFAKASPGTLLMLATIEDAARKGLRSYEFLGHAEPWTELWTRDLRPCIELQAYPASARALRPLAHDARAIALERGRTRARRAFHRVMARAARSYVSGPELSDALATAGRVAARGHAVTACYWDGPGDDRRDVAAAYAAAGEALAASELDAYLSVKAPALGYDRALAHGALATAGASMRVHFDALGADTQTPTLDLAEALALPDMGCTLPARWERSAADAERALELGLAVRVVKGQFPDPAGDTDPDAGFLALIDALAGRARHVAVATHDVKLLEEALRRLAAAGTPHEAELLYGLPLRAPAATARAAGVKARVYVPYGSAWLPYAFASTLREPRKLWWLARDAALGRKGI